jgi:hypothetical protein
MKTSSPNFEEIVRVTMVTLMLLWYSNGWLKSSSRWAAIFQKLGHASSDGWLDLLRADLQYWQQGLHVAGGAMPLTRHLGEIG